KRVVWEKEISVEGNGILTKVNLNLQELPAGRFNLRSVDEDNDPNDIIDYTFLKWSSGGNSNLIGVLEIVVDPKRVGNGYSLFKTVTNGLPDKAPEFTIFWKNRATKWRYVFKKQEWLKTLPQSKVAVFLKEEGTDSSTISRDHISLSLVSPEITLQVPDIQMADSEAELLEENEAEGILLPAPTSGSLSLVPFKQGVGEGAGAMIDKSDSYVSTVYMEF
ncbi:MAG: hypothetical protein AAGC85_21965, partial [Bacteroidota bacterium]